MKNKVSLNLNVSLLEIILSILIFAAAGIIMLNCFAIARFTQIRANDKAVAGAILQSELEIIKSIKSTDEMYDFLNNTYETTSISHNNHTYTKYYDENWNQNTTKEYAVAIMVTVENLISGELVNINISVKKEKPYPFIKKEGTEQIYSIESKKFFSNFGGSYDE